MAVEEVVYQTFEERFGEAPAIVVRAPGRVNLIGEHTDYNDGFVMPLAIDRASWIALRPRPDRRVIVRARFRRAGCVRPGRPGRRGSWSDYVGWPGADCSMAGIGGLGRAVLAGDVPIEQGSRRRLRWSWLWRRSLRCPAGHGTQRTWRASAGCREPVGGHELRDHGPDDLGRGVADHVADRLPHAGDPAAAAALNGRGGARHDHTAVWWIRPTTRRAREAAAAPGCLHCATSRSTNWRPLGAARLGALTYLAARDHGERSCAAGVRCDGRWRRCRLGRLLDASHASLRDDFEVSSHELNVIVEVAQAHRACLGAHDGRWASAVARSLVAEGGLADFVVHAIAGYTAATGLVRAFTCRRATDGAAVVRGVAV